MQQFFVYNGKQIWTEDYPRRVMDGECYKAGIHFSAVVGSMGNTGVKTHIGSAHICEFDDGTMKLDGLHAGCGAGTASRGGCSGTRPSHYVTMTGIADINCKNKGCQKYNGVNLDKLNETPWVEVRTFYGVVPHNHHV
jgi:hypothetical protein